MGNNPGISNIQILIETCSQDRYGEDGNGGESEGALSWACSLLCGMRLDFVSPHTGALWAVSVKALCKL